MLWIAYLRRNAVAYLALFVALGGTSWAAVNLPRNSVGSGQLKRGAVAATDIRTGAVTSQKVRDRSLRSQDFARGVLRQGPAGAAGAPGPAGAQGPAGPQGATGPAGPTEGTSSDIWGTLTPELTFDPSPFTTTRAGRVHVTKSMPWLQIHCSAGSWATWLLVDGVRVPGTVIASMPSGTSLFGPTFTGVTGRLAAGPHEARVGIACDPGNETGAGSQYSGGVSAVVLGG